MKKGGLSSSRWFLIKVVFTRDCSVLHWGPGVTFILFLQDYLREQPDNIKSVNLVAETTRFLNILYGNVNNKSAPLIIQLFDTLVEFTSVSTSISCVEPSVTVSQSHSSYMEASVTVSQSHSSYMEPSVTSKSVPFILYGTISNKLAPLIQLFDTLVAFTSVSTAVVGSADSLPVGRGWGGGGGQGGLPWKYW